MPNQPKPITPDQTFDEALSLADREYSAKTKKLTPRGPGQFDTVHRGKNKKPQMFAEGGKVELPPEQRGTIARLRASEEAAKRPAKVVASDFVDTGKKPRLRPKAQEVSTAFSKGGMVPGRDYAKGKR